MSDLYGSLDEKKKKRKKRKKAGSESSKESSLRDWFGRKGAKGKKKGWVDCNAPDGKGGYKSCGRGSGEKRKKYPACRPTPGACKERGKGKSWGKKAKKRKNEEIFMDLEQIIQEELQAVLDEKRKKKKKKSSGKKDACYNKVKSRYKVWPSADASGALVKCRKVGAKNWGNSKKESLQIMIEDELSQILNEKEDKYKPHDMYDPKSREKHDAKKEKDHLDMAKKGFVHVDPKKIEQILRDEGGAAGMDPFLKEFGEEMKDEIVKALENMPNVAQHEDGDYILDDDKDVDISEGMNCGCGQDPCETYGKKNSKIIAIVNEETEKYLEESLYYGLIDEEQAEKETLSEKKKKKACKPRKGKKYAKRVGGKCKSYGAKGYRISPGTSKGDSYCARSYGDMKSHGKDCSGKDRGTPLCLSRQKWKCSGKYSRKGK